MSGVRSSIRSRVSDSLPGVSPLTLSVGQFAKVVYSGSWQDWKGLIVLMTEKGLITIGRDDGSYYRFVGHDWERASLAKIRVEVLKDVDITLSV